MRRWTGAVCCMLLLLFQACKTTEQVKQPDRAFSREEKQRFRELLRNAPEYHTFISKMNLTLRSGNNSFTTKATLRIIKDSLLQISIQPLMGIEMFRIQVTPDSIVIVDKPGRRYMAEAIADYRSVLPVDLHLASLQSLFLNRIFIPGSKESPGTLQLQDFNSDSGPSGQWNLSPVKETQWKFGFLVDRNNLLEETQISAFPGTQALRWVYSEFQKRENIYFPMHSGVTVSGLGTPVDVEWNYQRPEWNKPVKTDLSVSSRYRRVEGSEIFKTLLK